MKTYYPVNLDILAKKCLVVGGGNVAERKIRSLLDFGAKVEVVSPENTSGIVNLAKKNIIKLQKRKYRASDLNGSFLVIAATNDPLVNNEISKAARAMGMLVNIIDAPSLCNFIAPSYIKRGPLVVSISTSGNAPALSKALRLKLEKIITAKLGKLVLKMGKIRKARKENLNNGNTSFRIKS